MRREAVYGSTMWVGIPLIHWRYYSEDQAYLDNQATLRIRVSRPYERYASNAIIDESILVANKTLNNDFYPVYKFATDEIAIGEVDPGVQASQLDIIKAVPNPYYGLSAYDANQLENNIKIINLPHTCTITIFNSGGQLIRQFSKSSEQTYQIWDLKNSKNIPIASGMYIIHVNAPGIGEKTIKWFGQLRPVDLNAF